jgi:hypothetical protein
MKNYFEEAYQHYIDLKTKLENLTGTLSDEKNLEKAFSQYDKDLNNLIMSGLGMGTLYLRMGAVLMIAEKTKPEAEKDVSFLKVIAEKLIHKLPADGEWKDIWNAYLSKNNKSEWNKIYDSTPSIPKTEDKIHEAFVTFRNNIVHQDIIITSVLNANEIKEILKGIKILDGMSRFREYFVASIINFENNEVYFQSQSDAEKLKISPYVQLNKNKEAEDVGVLPYLFQGKYYKGSKFINTEGAETNQEKDDAIDDTFDTIKKDIQQFNGDKAFNFDEKISIYNDWCIGRDEEVSAILEWINNSDTDKNVLPIFAPAGMGKGALVAKVIKNFKDKKINHLYHFCGSRNANNLQAILYHLILQGKENEYWNTNSLSEKFKNRLERLPSQYTDVIELFQEVLCAENTITESEKSKALNNANIDGKFNALHNVLLKLTKEKINEFDKIVEEFSITAKQLIDLRGQKLQIEYFNYLFDIHFNLTKMNLASDLLDYIPNEHRNLSKKYYSPLVIIIDGLDEAEVSDHSKKISDWFYTYNDEGKRKEKWECPDHIKWIFTYRQTSKENKEGFQFEYHEFKTYDLLEMQPLKGLNLTQEKLKEELKKDLKEDTPDLTDEFITAILEKGETKEYKTINV